MKLCLNIQTKLTITLYTYGLEDVKMKSIKILKKYRNDKKEKLMSLYMFQGNLNSPVCHLQDVDHVVVTCGDGKNINRIL